MKTVLIVAGACALAAALAGCSTANTQAMTPIVSAIAAEIPHCHVSGSFNAGAGGLAGTGTGLAAANQFDCPAQPWPAAAAAVPVAPTPPAP